MRFFSAPLVVILILVSPSVAYQQKGQSAEKNSPAANSPNQTSPVTVVVNQPTAKERDHRSEEKAANGPPIYSNWALVIVAAIAAIAGLRTLRQIKRQAQITEDTLRLTHRPKIIVRNIAIPALKYLNRKSPMNLWTQELTGYYSVANVGGLPAKISRIIEGIWCDRELPMERPDRVNPGRTVDTPIAPGEAKEIDFARVVLSTEDAMNVIDGKFKAFFLVQIEYTDAAGIVRRTSARRKFDGEAFTRVDNPDYEYTD